MNVTGWATIFVGGVSILSSVPVAAQDATVRGRAIVEEVERRSQGYGDLEAELLMTILDGDRQTIREMHVRALESEDGDRTRMTLKRPADLAGTEFLSALDRDGGRNQWIYLPTARRVRRIGGAQATDEFLGSHFTYDDLTPPNIAGFTYRWIREEDIEGHAGALVERISIDERDQFPRQLLWIDTDRYVLKRVEFFTSAGERLRVLGIDQYQQVGGFWLAGKMTMAHVSDGGSTVLDWSDMRVGVGLSPRDFDPSRLGR